MDYRESGSSGLRLSAIGLGCWSFGGGDYWGKQDQKDVEEVVHAAVDLGINYFDTAEMYNEGRSESSLGQAIKGLKRDKLVIGTKVPPSCCYPRVLEEHCNASLKRLDTDYIDLYMIHWPIHRDSIRFFTTDEKILDNPPDNDEAFRALLSLKKSGKIRHIGISNYSKTRILKDIKPGYQVEANQLPYNLLSRAIEFDTIEHCNASGIGIISYITLMQGILTGKYPVLQDVPPIFKRTRHFSSESNPKSRHGEKGFEDLVQAALDEIRILADETSRSMTDLATGWVVAGRKITCAIAGVRNIDQLKVNTAVLRDPLKPDVVRRLNDMTEELKAAMGNCLDYYQNKAEDRTV